MPRLTRAESNASMLELERYLDACCKTAWPMQHKLMEVMRIARFRGFSTDGRVEIDDSCLGGAHRVRR
jgi:hypothetical protein